MTNRQTQIQNIKRRANVCTDCDLANTRTNVVFGSGDVNAKLVVVGEGPSAADNHTEFPFSGPAGNMLDEVFSANGLTRSNIWLTNIIKCRAAANNGSVLKNRPPKAAEIKACSKWLDSELTLIRPSVILCLGAPLQKHLFIPASVLQRNAASGLKILVMHLLLWQRLIQHTYYGKKVKIIKSSATKPRLLRRGCSSDI